VGVHGDFSAFYIFTNPRNRPVFPSTFSASDVDVAELMTNPPRIVDKLRVAMLVNGVDFSIWPGGTLSIAHTDEDVGSTAEAFREALRMLRGEGEL
jgi:glutamate-1-semialdehyde 2,1-aminomutase